MELKKKEDIVKPILGREVWKNSETNRIEEKFMSPFIVEHLDEISKISGYELEVVDTEVSVGDFRADIVCKDITNGDIVIIENQLEESDHDHLGKALTYLANLDAKGIIWVCENVRPEHRKAIEKLNEITSEEYNFYFLELKFEKYNNDSPYYYFNQVFIPSSINKLSTNIKNNTSESGLEINEFMQKFIKDLQTKVSSARYIKGKYYHKIYNTNKFWSVINMSPKDYSTTFEIGYDKRTIKDFNKYDEYANKIMNELNTKYGYNFIYSPGKKTPEVIKLLYTINIDKETEYDKFIDICVNIANVMKNIIN